MIDTALAVAKVAELFSPLAWKNVPDSNFHTFIQISNRGIFLFNIFIDHRGECRVNFFNKEHLIDWTICANHDKGKEWCQKQMISLISDLLLKQT